MFPQLIVSTLDTSFLIEPSLWTYERRGKYLWPINAELQAREFTGTIAYVFQMVPSGIDPSPLALKADTLPLNCRGGGEMHYNSDPSIWCGK